MNKPVKLTNQMRDDIALKLTASAVAKNSAKIGAKLEKLNDKFWRQHSANVTKLLKIDSSRWPDLIQAGVLSGVTTVFPEYKMHDGNTLYAFYSETSQFNDRLLDAAELKPISRFVVTRRGWSNDRILSFESPCSVPRINNMHFIEVGKPMMTAIDEIKNQVIDLLAAAWDFDENVRQILYSCNNSRQLEELLPEAAKLVPQPVRIEGLPAPTGLAKEVQEMLKTGIPQSRAAKDDKAIQL